MVPSPLCSGCVADSHFFLALWLLLYSNSVCFEAYVTTQSLFLVGAPSSLLHACLNNLRQNSTIFLYDRRYVSFLSNDCILNPILSCVTMHPVQPNNSCSLLVVPSPLCSGCVADRHFFLALWLLLYSKSVCFEAYTTLC